MDHDVIIVGGRPAGASLAARLGARGIRVLLVDRSTFPSLPGVPSSPAIYPGCMAQLDDLGVDESSYAHAGVRINAFVAEMQGAFAVKLRLPMMIGGRDYALGIERNGFDLALWKHVERSSSVERREGFHVTDLLREGDRVTGVVGGPRGEPPQRITAGCVVGADGRFSSVARKVGAPVVLEQAEHTSTVYYADFHGAGPIAGDDAGALVYTTGRGLDVLSFATPGGRLCVNIHARSDRVHVEGDAQRYFTDTLRAHPRVWRYLEGAEQVTPVVGLKKVGNGYRRASGRGWVLVGDAYHYKDPVDGQGIYDALLETKLLDRALAAWHGGSLSWDAAMSRYEREAFEATHPMFQVTMGRLKTELYTEPPVPVIHSLIRWTLTDPVYQDQFTRLLGRDIAPDGFPSRGLMAGAAARGLARDARALLERRPLPGRDLLGRA